MRHTGSCCDPGSSGAGHQLWGHVTALGLEVCVVSLTQGSKSINNCVVLGGGITVAAKAVGVLFSLVATPGSSRSSS